MSTEPALAAEARRIVEEAAGRDVPVRLLGGIAIWLRSPADVRDELGREYGDIDLAAPRKRSRALRDVLEALGYVPDKMFNATQGDRRLYFSAADGSYHLDVFLDKFVMSHELDLGRRLETEPIVLPAAELLLTKLQIAELNRKDASDTAMLLLGHALDSADGPGTLNVAHVTEVCAENWGLYTTVTDNLATTRQLLAELLPNADRRALVDERIGSLLDELEAAPKSRGWRRRAKIGRRKRWYEVPDEV